MRKHVFVFLGLAAITAAASTAAFADNYSLAGAGVSGSRHDINAFAANGGVANVVADSQERVCAFCHTPHHAYTKDMTGATAADYLPLWSHELTAKTYTGYASDSLQAVIGDPLIGPSRLCMSCHDGVVAVDTHYTKLGTVKDGAELRGDDFAALDKPALSGAVGLGESLAGDHPIGFDYIAAQAADKTAGGALVTGIRDADTNYFMNEKGDSTGIKIKDVLHAVDGVNKKYMTCSSCHEVHNRDNVKQKFFSGDDMIVDTIKINYFLYGSQSGSKICLSCHDK